MSDISDSERELFGDPVDSRSASEVEDADRHSSDDERMEKEPEREPVRRSLDIKRYPPSHAFSSSWVSRVPAFLQLEPRPFDAEQYIALAKNEDDMAVEANTIRWKYAAADDADVGNSDEKVKRVSNARVVTWSDGSKTLQLGNEHFEIKTHDQPEPVFVCARQNNGDVLETRQLVNHTMSFLPTSTASATHAMLARSLQRKHLNSQIRVGTVNTTEDPEKVQREVERTEQAKEKARRKLSSQREDIISLASHTQSFRSQSGMDESMDEQSASNSENDMVDDDEDEDEDRASRLNRAKYNTNDSEEEEEENTNLNESAKEGEASPEHGSQSFASEPLPRRKVLDDDDSE